MHPPVSRPVHVVRQPVAEPADLWGVEMPLCPAPQPVTKSRPGPSESDGPASRGRMVPISRSQSSALCVEQASRI